MNGAWVVNAGSVALRGTWYQVRRPAERIRKVTILFTLDLLPKQSRPAGVDQKEENSANGLIGSSNPLSLRLS